MDNQTVAIVNRKNIVEEIFEKDKLFWEDVKKLDVLISSNQAGLSKSLALLDKERPGVDVKRYWYGATNIDSIKESMTNVYGELRKYIHVCGDAIRTTNDNLSHTLKLIKLLAIIEKDLYEKLDDESIQSSCLFEIFHDWCQENNIKDKEVNELLDASFQRAYTLRDRIHSLRLEINNKLERYDTDLKKISEELDTMKTFVALEKTKALDDIAQSFKSKEDELCELTNNQKSEMVSLYNEYINDYTARLSEQFESYMSELQSRKEDIDSLLASVEKNASKLNLEMFEFSKKQSKQFTLQEQKYKEQIVNQQIAFEKELEGVKSIAKKYFIAGVASSVILTAIISSVISYFV